MTRKIHFHCTLRIEAKHLEMLKFPHGIKDIS